MSYPANHTPDARDGVEGLLEQIASSVGAITDDVSSVEDKLAAIATALAAAEAAAAAPEVTLTSLGLVDTSAVVKVPVSVGDGTVTLENIQEFHAELIAGLTATEIAAWQAQILLAPPRTVTTATDTLLTTDVGKVIVYNSGSDITVTLPDTLAAGYSVACFQQGAGQVNFVTTGTDSTVTNVDGHYWTRGAGAMVTLFVFANSDGGHSKYVLAGATAITT